MEKQEYQGYTGVWRRMKSGAAVFIRDGEDIKTAVRRNFNSKKMESKRKELIDKEADLYRKTNEYRKKTRDLFEEKGELSQEFADAQKLHETYARARENATLDRSAYEYEMDKVETRNKKGIKIKQDEFDAIKKSGMTPKQKAEAIKTKNKFDEDVEKYYGSSSVESITADLEERIHRMEKDLYAPNDKEIYQQWNEATERYLISRMRGKEKLLDKYQTPKQKAQEIDDANQNNVDFSKMTRKQLAEYIVDDQIRRGVVTSEKKDMLVEARLNGAGLLKRMSKQELIKGAKDTFDKKDVNNMSRAELVEAAYNQTKQIDNLRGYDSGLRKEHLERFSEETLRRIYLENKQNFKL